MPGIAPDDVPPAVQGEGVSAGGDPVQQALLGAGFDLTTNRRAAVLPAAVAATGRYAVASTGPLLSHLVEPDDAVIRAGLVAELAADLHGHLLDPHIAWITTDSPAAEPFGRAYRVEAELPFREKQLRAALRERDIGTLTVKKR